MYKEKEIKNLKSAIRDMEKNSENLNHEIRRGRKLGESIFRGFQLRVFHFALYSKRKSRSWKTSEFDQSTSEFDETTSEQISEVFNSDFSVLGIVQN